MYKTGDLGRMLPSEKMVYISRKDDQFKFHGIRIEKAEIEQALSQHDQISDCHVIKLPPGTRAAAGCDLLQSLRDCFKLS